MRRALPGRHRDVLGERAPHIPHVRRPAFHAHRGPAPAARSAPAASRRRIEDHPLAARPCRSCALGRGHGARPLVTEDGAGPDVVVEDEMEVRPADPARRHLDEKLARSGLGHGDLLDGDPALPHADRRGHQTLARRPCYGTEPSPALRPRPPGATTSSPDDQGQGQPEGEEDPTPTAPPPSPLPTGSRRAPPAGAD